MATTLKVIAEEAGVSIRTVTRALKDEPGGNVNTYKKVRQIADQLGYIPNIAARNLKTQRITMVGLITPKVTTNVVIREKMALQHLLEREGRFLISGTIPDTKPGLRTMLREWSGLASHVVIMGWHRHFGGVDVLTGMPMKFIFVDCFDPQTEHDGITVDRGTGVREGIEDLFSKGYRRIARCGIDMPNRRNGFDSAFTNADQLEAQQVVVVTAGLDLEEGYRVGQRLLDEKVDAVFFETDQLAFGFYRFAYERGIRIPDDIAVIGFDDEPACAVMTPALSTIRHPIERITNEVYSRLAHDQEQQSVVVHTRYVPRAST